MPPTHYFEPKDEAQNWHDTFSSWVRSCESELSPGFVVAELLGDHFSGLDPESVAKFLGQIRMGRSWTKEPVNDFDKIGP